ncbi:MAG: DUF3662 and FHA domain-containing protein [Dermatophilaceae bacterium]
MGLFDKVERGLERAVNSAFAKAFRSEVQPAEIASAIRRRMDDRATVLAPGRTMVPNVYSIELSPSDFTRIDEFSDSISDDLVAAAQEHAETQHYLPGGDFQVHFYEASDLDTGVFRVDSETSKRGADAPRPPRESRHSSEAGMPSAHAPEPPHRPGPGGHSPAQSPAHGAVAAGASSAASASSAAAAAAKASAAPPHGDPLAALEAEDALAARDHAGDAARDHAGHAAGEHSDHPDHAASASPAVGGQPSSAISPPARRPSVNLAHRPWLEIDHDRYPLIGSLTVIGRDALADVILDDPGISRRHSEIRVTNDGPHLVSSVRDLGSTNGTFVNGERITSTRLKDGDRLTVGRTTIHFHAGKR